MYKAINQDVHPRYNAEGYNYALNVNKEDGDRVLIHSDFSNEFCVDFKAKVIGHCLDKNNNYVVFLSNNSIVRFYPDICKFDTLYQNDELNFSNWIECVYTIFKGCEELVYFTDGVNKYRVINLDRIAELDDIKKLNYNTSVDAIPINAVISLGGNLNAGTYFYTYRLIDSAGTPSNFNMFYPPVNIQDSDLVYNDIDKVKTNKIINFELNEKLIQDGYSFQIAIIEYSNLSKATSAVYLLPENSRTFTGTNYLRTSTTLDLIVDKLVVDRVMTHTKLHNRLFIGNTQTTQYAWEKIQKLANLIPSFYRTTKHEKTSENLSFKSFRHGDVYDFGIVGVFPTGKTTPVFHIPGRLADPSLTGFTTGETPNKNVKSKLDTELISNKDADEYIRGVCSIYCTDLIELEYTVSSIRLPQTKIQFKVDYIIRGLPKADVNIKFSYNSFNPQVTNSSSNLLSGTILSGIYKDLDIDYVDFTVQIKSDLCSYEKVHEYGKFGVYKLSPLSTKVDNLPRWHLRNTALRHKSAISGESSGLMAYYEACEYYPDDTDCSGEPIYPHKVHDINGQPVYTMLPIRYHRMPDQLLEPVERGNYIHRIEPFFDLSQFLKDVKDVYPELFNEIIEWRLVYGERLNPIVKDSGLLFNSLQAKADFKDTYLSDIGTNRDDVFATIPILNSAKTTPSGFGNNRLYGGNLEEQREVLVFYSPSTILENKIYTGSFVVNRQARAEVSDFKALPKKAKQGASTGQRNQIRQSANYVYDLIRTKSQTTFPYFNPSGKYIIPINLVKLVAPVKTTYDSDGAEYLGTVDFLGDFLIRNMLYSVNSAFYLCNALKLGPNALPFRNCFFVDIIGYNQPYTFETTTYHELNEGDTWISPFIFSLKVPTYVPPKKFSIGITDWLNDGAGRNIEREVQTKILVRSYLEHDINMEYRFHGNEPYKKAYKFGNVNYSALLDADRKKIGGADEEDAIWEYFPDFQKYSFDYSLFFGPKPYRKLPRHYDFCSDCTDSVPNRIYYSDAANVDNNIDHFRSIRINNYTMLEEEVNTIFKANDDLFARTNKYIYNIPTKQVEIKTDSANAYIGPRELFGIPPVKLGSVDYLFGGSDQKLDFAGTEMGIFFTGSHLMHYTDKLGVIEEGLRNFLRNNFIQFNKQHNNIAYKDYISISNPQRMFNLCYDYIHNRLFLSKQEYLILPQFKDSIRLINKEPYLTKGDIKIPVSFTDTRYFINSSYNISYSPAYGGFISFHSWIPDYTMFDSRAYYSLKGTELWKHLDTTSNTKRLTYYGKTYPMIIDIPLQAKGNQTSMWDSIMYRQDLTNSELMPRRDILGNVTTGVMNTFTHYVAYNDVQSTGIIPLVLKQNIFDPSNLSQVENRFNFIIGREMALNDKILDWNIVEERRDIMLLTNNEFEDKLFPSNNLNDIRAFNQARLRDDYMNLRLIYDPNLFVDHNYILNKLNLDIVDSNTTISLPK